MLALFRHGFMLQNQMVDIYCLYPQGLSSTLMLKVLHSSQGEENSCRRAVRATLPDVQAGF